MTLCAEGREVQIKKNLLPYGEDLEHRSLSDITTVVFHCTELPTIEMTLEYALKEKYESGTGDSGHYYLDRDGTVWQYVELDRTAHHVRDRNHDTVGVEIVNTGRYPDWHHLDHQQMTEPYTEKQYKSCEELLARLMAVLPSLREVTRHSDLDGEWVPSTDCPELMVRRKVDPGPLFDWGRIKRFWDTISR